ncbi:large-conductance mechanosensitive channel [Hyaloraphidium curvatum]|nr:large-conductance mechanosensitive channel [Hyaloraphidium curvatum]
MPQLPVPPPGYTFHTDDEGRIRTSPEGALLLFPVSDPPPASDASPALTTLDGPTPVNERQSDAADVKGVDENVFDAAAAQDGAQASAEALETADPDKLLPTAIVVDPVLAPTDTSFSANANKAFDKALGVGGDVGKAALNVSHSMIKDFLRFMRRGNIVYIALGFVMGTAFTAIVNSFVNDMINPIIGLMGTASLSNLNTVMRPGESGATEYPTVAQAQLDGAITLAWGSFLNSIINFLLIAVVCFFIVQLISVVSRRRGAFQAQCFWCMIDMNANARGCLQCGMEQPTPEQAEIIRKLETKAQDEMAALGSGATIEQKFEISSRCKKQTREVLDGQIPDAYHQRGADKQKESTFGSLKRRFTNLKKSATKEL